jgi:glycosyltransferase involved in cell wall biosynthesis
MRVAVASNGLGHVTRGIESWAADLAHALHKRGVSVVLFKGGGKQEKTYERVIRCLQRGSPRTAKLMRIIPRRFFWRFGFGSSIAIEQTTFALSLLPHLRREAIDVLHVQDPLVALIVQRAQRFGLVRTRAILGHGTNETFDYLEAFDYLHQLAPHHLEEAHRAGVWKPAWRVIPNFVDCESFRPGRAVSLRTELGIPRDGLVLLTVAMIDRKVKRIDYLMSEFAQLLENCLALPAWLVVAGGRESDTELLIEQGRKVLGDRVRFLVQYPRDQMPELYRIADIFVLCSLKEMMPVALVEATASGLPCVVHRNPVCEWIVGPSGEAIDMAEPGALVAALRTLFHDPNRRRICGERARQHCLESFSQDRVVNQIVDYYRFVQGHNQSSRMTGSIASGADTMLTDKFAGDH